MRARDKYLVREDGRLLIRTRRWRQAGLAVFLGYVGVIGALLVGASVQDLVVSRSPDALWGLGLGGLLVWLFGKPGLTLARRAVRDEPVLIIDHAGVTFPRSPLGQLSWLEIVDYRTSRLTRLTGGTLGSVAVRLRVSEPRAVIARAPESRRWRYRAATALAGSPVLIPLALLPLDAAELVDELDHYRPRVQRLRR